MPDTQLSTQLIVSFWGAIAAGVMQVSVMALLAFRLPTFRWVASFVVSAIFGGGIGLILQYKGMHPHVAGVISAFLGALPAVLVPMLITNQVLKKAGVDFDDLNIMLSKVRCLDDDEDLEDEIIVAKVTSKEAIKVDVKQEPKPKKVVKKASSIKELVPNELIELSEPEA